VRVRFVLDAEGRRQEVRDHFDRLVLSFDYLDGRLVAAFFDTASMSSPMRPMGHSEVESVGFTEVR